jgi:serine/threonine protein kinase
MTASAMRPPGGDPARDTPVKRSLITPVLPRRAPRRLTGRRGADDAATRARAACDVDDHGRLVAACAERGYELLAPIGSGGMGRVWLARGVGASAAAPVVAIKAMLPRVASDAEFRAMFVDEGRIASRITSPHVARVLGLHEIDGVLFQVMEWVDGESLLDLHAAASRGGQRIPMGVVVRALADACDGLHAAHEARGEDGRPLNVVHRDVSPANVLVSARGEVKLVDFGIAKARARVAHSTIGFALKGRIHYVAPEYALGEALDRRADTWSMGATLYFLLCGRAPYAASNEAAALFKLTSGEPVPPLPGSVPRDVAEIVHRAIARAPGDRFATASEMRDALQRVAGRLGAEASRASVARFVAEHESVRTRERRVIAGDAHAESPAPTEEAARSFHVPESILAGIALVAVALSACVLMTLPGALALAPPPPPPPTTTTVERAPKSIEGDTTSELVLELPASPAPRGASHAAPPRVAPARSPAEASPIGAPPSAAPSAPRPVRRHYGF